jgi:hypothetical protein
LFAVYKGKKYGEDVYDLYTVENSPYRLEFEQTELGIIEKYNIRIYWYRGEKNESN